MKLLRMNGVVYRVAASGALQRQGAASVLHPPVPHKGACRLS